MFGLKLDKATFHVGLQDGGGGGLGGWGWGGGDAVRKLCCQWGRTIGEDRGGAADKKHNKTHHLFVRMPRCKLRQTLLVFSSCCVSASGGEAAEREDKTEPALFAFIMFTPKENCFVVFCFNLPLPGV